MTFYTDVELADDGIHWWSWEIQLIDDLEEMDNDYTYDWCGPGWYQYIFDEYKIVFNSPDVNHYGVRKP